MQSRNDMKKRVTFSVRTEIKNLRDEVMRDQSLNTDPLLNQMQALRNSLKSVRKHSERVPVLTAFNNEHLKDNDSIVAQLMRLSFNSYLVQLKPLLRSDKQLRKMVTALSKAISNEIDKQRLVFSQEQQDIINSIQESLEALREDEGSVYSQTTRRSVRSLSSTRRDDYEVPSTPIREEKRTHKTFRAEEHIGEEEKKQVEAPLTPPSSPILKVEEEADEASRSDQNVDQHASILEKTEGDSIPQSPEYKEEQKASLQHEKVSSPMGMFSGNHQDQSPTSNDTNSLEQPLLSDNREAQRDEEEEFDDRQRTCLDVCTIS